MSADKHRRLARRTAWLRLAARGQNDGTPSGFALQIKWGHALTADIEALVSAGDAIIERCGPCGCAQGEARKRSSKSYRYCRATLQGLNTLALTLAQHGPDFGPLSLIDELDPPKARKPERRATHPTLRRHSAKRQALLAKARALAKSKSADQNPEAALV